MSIVDRLSLPSLSLPSSTKNVIFKCGLLRHSYPDSHLKFTSSLNSHNTVSLSLTLHLFQGMYV